MLQGRAYRQGCEDTGCEEAVSKHSRHNAAHPTSPATHTHLLQVSHPPGAEHKAQIQAAQHQLLANLRQMGCAVTCNNGGPLRLVAVTKGAIMRGVLFPPGDARVQGAGPVSNGRHENDSAGPLGTPVKAAEAEKGEAGQGQGRGRGAAGVPFVLSMTQARGPTLSGALRRAVLQGAVSPLRPLLLVLKGLLQDGGAATGSSGGASGGQGGGGGGVSSTALTAMLLAHLQCECSWTRRVGRKEGKVGRGTSARGQYFGSQRFQARSYQDCQTVLLISQCGKTHFFLSSSWPFILSQSMPSHLCGVCCQPSSCLVLIALHVCQPLAGLW